MKAISIPEKNADITSVMPIAIINEMLESSKSASYNCYLFADVLLLTGVACGRIGCCKVSEAAFASSASLSIMPFSNEPLLFET
jgi:hypothetical protein